jgi:hypothetical protein
MLSKEQSKEHLIQRLNAAKTEYTEAAKAFQEVDQTFSMAAEQYEKACGKMDLAENRLEMAKKDVDDFE